MHVPPCLHHSHTQTLFSQLTSLQTSSPPAASCTDVLPVSLYGQPIDWFLFSSSLAKKPCCWWCSGAACTQQLLGMALVEEYFALNIYLSRQLRGLVLFFGRVITVLVEG